MRSMNNDFNQFSLVDPFYLFSSLYTFRVSLQAFKQKNYYTPGVQNKFLIYYHNHIRYYNLSAKLILKHRINNSIDKPQNFVISPGVFIKIIKNKQYIVSLQDKIFHLILQNISNYLFLIFSINPFKSVFKLQQSLDLIQV